MKYVKMFGFLICLGAVPMLALGYGATGHARQQMRLLADDVIGQALELTATRLTLPELPLTLMDNEAPLLRNQLDVLVAEGLLQREKVLSETRDLTPLGWVMRATSGERYFRSPEKQGDTISFGEPDLNRIGEVRLNPQSDGATTALVFFTWSVDALAEWVWAPAFDTDPRLNRIKSSRQTPIAGRAELEWRREQWQLTSLQLFGEQ